MLHKNLSNLIYAFFLYVLVSLSDSVVIAQQIRCPIQSIYQFGDSISDTGNLVRIFPSVLVPAGRRPYGETFPGNPTGRWSDGRLIIDYIATALELPLLNPYLDKTASFSNGVNYAVAGTTTLDPSFYFMRGIKVLPAPTLRPQFNLFKTYLNSTCSTPTECANKLSRSLIFVGEFGYNDVYYPFYQGRSVQEIRTYVPFVNQLIINTTRELIQSGASQVVVPGNFPLGCFPAFLSVATPQNVSTAYDDRGCLKSLNDLATYENDYRQRALESLRQEFPNAVILYADFYNAFESVFREAASLGFDIEKLLIPCCGVKGQYNPFLPVYCGTLGVPVCPNPNVRIHWDGVHLTQEAYRRISEIIIRDLRLNCTS